MSSATWTIPFKLFIWFARLCGVEIDPVRLGSAPKRYKTCLLFYAVLSFLVNVIAHLTCDVLLYKKYVANEGVTSIEPRSRDFIYAGNYVIELVFSSLLNVGVHGWMIIKSQDNEWKALWTKLKRLLPIESRPMRNTTYIGGAILLLVTNGSLKKNTWLS